MSEEYGYEMTPDSILEVTNGDMIEFSVPVRAVSKSIVDKVIGAIPIVRCKNCKHYEEFTTTVKGNSQTIGWCKRDFNYLDVESDDFCSKGELKSE